jgi:hypothetical protein
MSRSATQIVFALALGACGGERTAHPAQEPPQPELKPTTPPLAAPAQPTAFMPFACPSPTEGTGTAADMLLRATDLRLSREVDYLAIVELRAGERLVLGERGTVCSGASDQATCHKAVSTLEAELPRPEKKVCLAQICTGLVYVLTTQGDVASVARGVDEVRTMLGPIDSPREAWLLAQVALGATTHACGDAELSAYRPLATGGYELRERAFTQRCRPVEKSEIVYRVDDTSQRTVETKVLSSEGWCMEEVPVSTSEEPKKARAKKPTRSR